MNLFKEIRKLMFRFGYRFDRTAKDAEILNAINLMKPIPVGHDLIRIGREGDGGYLIPDDLDGVACCFSPGVSAIADFEEMLAEKHGIRSYLTDYSVKEPPVSNPLIDFEKKYLGVTNDAINMRLEEWVTTKVGSAPDGDMILQMDIEGHEFAVLLDTPAKILKKFRIIVIEFHAMEMMFDRASLRLVTAVFEKLASEFHVAHIHPNNCNSCQLYKVGDIEIPRTFEATLIRKDRVRPDTRRLVFPHPLDRKNVPSNPDIVLPKIWYQ